jgi:hypothetical protein
MPVVVRNPTSVRVELVSQEAQLLLHDRKLASSEARHGRIGLYVLKARGAFIIPKRHKCETDGRETVLALIRRRKSVPRLIGCIGRRQRLASQNCFPGALPLVGRSLRLVAWIDGFIPACKALRHDLVPDRARLRLRSVQRWVQTALEA